MSIRHLISADRRPTGAWTAAAAVVMTSVAAVAVASPVSADVAPGGQLCFTINATPGDAAIVNLTPVLADGDGFGQLISSNVKNNPPNASNTNFTIGSVDPNVAITPIGNDGQVCYQNSPRSSVDLIADHLGTINANAYTPATPNGAPTRRVDTRTGQGGQRIAPGGQLCFTINATPGDAAIVNLTPVLADGDGFGQLISSNVKNNPPNASNTNFTIGSVDPNVAITPIGNDGQVCYQNSPRSSVDLIADHLGTINANAYTPATPNGAPTRRVDTRTGQGGQRIAPGGQLCFTINATPGDAAIVNLTPVLADGDGFGQLISSNVKNNPPNASNTNFTIGSVDPNVAITPIGNDGQVCYQNSPRSSVDLIADHLGTINANAYTPATPNGAPTRRVDTRTDDTGDEPEPTRPECVGSTSTNYDTETARTMFGLSSASYEIDPGAQFNKTLSELGASDFEERMTCWKLITALRGQQGVLGLLTDTELIVARNTQTQDVVVAFRGTEIDALDIFTDLNATRAPWRLPDGQVVPSAVHAGFAGAYLAVRDQLAELLGAQPAPTNPEARVYFTGHSLGGALASLASIDLVDDLMRSGYSRTEVVTYTFGAPRSMSQTMSNHHAGLVPVSFAVVNPRDPVPHVPSAIGSSNPFSHIRNVTVVHGSPATSTVRVERGDGRRYRGCLAMPIGRVTDHIRSEYNRRLESTSFFGDPRVWITISNGENRLNWDSPIEGPCDEVGLFRTGGTLTSAANPITTRNVEVDGDDIHTTSTGKGDNFWVGYINMFGDLVAAREYFPTTPTVSLERNENLIGGDTIDFDWSVSDPGDHDLIVLYDRDPRVAGVDGYYRSIVGRVEAKADSNPGERTQIRVGSDPNRWWVAYVMVDDDGNQRILSTSRGVQG